MRQILKHSPSWIAINVGLKRYQYSLLSKNALISFFWILIQNFAGAQNSPIKSPISDTYQQLDVSLKKVIDIREEEERHEQLKKLGYRFADIDPQKGWTLAATEFDTAGDKETFAMALLRRWGNAKPEDALRACNNLPEGEGRLLAYTSALIGWSKVDPRAASEWVSANLNSIYRRTAAGAVGRTWVEKDPEDAARWASAWPNETEKIFILGEVLESWGLEYGQEAAEWVSKMTDGKMKDLMMSKVILKWGENYPKTASDWLLKNEAHSWLLPRVIAKWAKYDHQSASIWIKRITEGDLALECKVALVTEWAQYNPRTAYAWIKAELKGDSQSMAMNEVLQIWAQEYPKDALNWITEAVPIPERAQALEIIIQTWSITDTRRFSSWLTDQRPGLEKDLGLEQLARMLINTDPQSAMKAARSIGNPIRQNEVSNQLLEQWKTAAPAEAAKWKP